MSKILKLTGMILLTAALAVFTNETKVYAYEYENWKDAVVNDNEVDLWENHYEEWINKSQAMGYRYGRFNASDLDNLEGGGFYFPQSRILLTKSNKTEQLTAFNAPGKVTWKSYDERVCTVDQSGLVTMGTHTGPTIVEAASEGRTMRVTVFAMTGNSPEWFEMMFWRAYRGEHFRINKDWWDPTLNTLKCFVDNGGSDYWKLFEDAYEAAQKGYVDCVDLVGRNETLLAPFFNIPGVEGICGVNGYTGHTTTIAYLKGQAYFLDNGIIRPINENGGGDGNIWGYNSGYKITNRYTNGFEFSTTNPDDLINSGSGKKFYPETRKLYFYN